jgi:hypothetical membrane protein
VRAAGWGVASSAAAPVLLIGGWTVAAALQRAGFDPVTGTISALAARDADRRWVMTSALAAVGVCHVTTAAALRSAATPGRVLLAAGGVGTALVAAFPLPAGGATSVPHTVAAGVAFTALSAWPALASRRRSDRLAAVALLVLLGWFVAELVADGPRVGLTERLAAAAQSLWPLAAVLTTGRTR